MKTYPPSVFLGDLARAIDALRPAGPDAEVTRSAIARLLGFEWRADLAPSSPEPGKPPELKSSPMVRPAEVKDPPSRPAPKASEPRAEPKWIPASLRTESTTSPGKTLASLFAVVQPLPPPSATDWEGPGLVPLLEPAWTRSIVTALVATCRDGEIDFLRLIDQLARVEPVQRLPRLPWPTLRRGVRLLADVGPGMTPFAADQRWLIDQIRQVVGMEKTRVERFTGCPSRGVSSGLEETISRWQPPLAGTPILVLTDLGASRTFFPGESASDAEWIEFALEFRRAGCPVIALVPHGPGRFSAALRGALHLVPWNRRTTAGRLQRRLGRAHAVS